MRSVASQGRGCKSHNTEVIPSLCNSELFNAANFSSTELVFLLVGKGEKGKGCGNLTPISCQSCIKTHFVRSRCKQKLCPDCWQIWLTKTTQRIALRLLSEDVRRRNSRMRLMHVIVSPDPEIVKDFVDGKITFAELKTTAVQYLYGKSIRRPSGCLIFHPFRPNERYYRERGEERREEDEKIDKELKKWEWIRNKEDWYSYVEFSPHFHFVGYIGWLEKPVEGEKFIYKLIPGKNGYRGIQDKKEVFRLIYYLLSHTGASPVLHTHTHVWTGNISYRKRVLYPKPKKKGVELKCKACSGPLIPLYDNMKAFF